MSAPGGPVSLRADLQLIAGWIAPRTHVLDLGCGDGALLAHLCSSASGGASA